MKQSSFFFKLAALVSSVLLVSGFVGYRAGAFHWGKARSAPTTESSTNDAIPQSSATETRTGSFLLMAGPKSDAGLTGGIRFYDQQAPDTPPPSIPPATNQPVAPSSVPTSPLQQ